MKAMWLFAFLFCALGAAAVSPNSDEVQLLGEEGPKVPSAKLVGLNAAAAKDIAHPGDGTQTGRTGALPTRAAPAGQAPMPNFPGTPYGKPGYKESHNWESDVDYFMPAVFNTKFFAAKYSLKDKTEEQLKAEWLAQATKEKAPKCPQGNSMFSLNQYVQNNPTAAEGDKTCKEVLDHYLRSGIFDGFDGSVGFPISTKGNKHSFALKKKQQVAENVVVKPARQYTYTFWLSVSDVMAPQTNVMQFGVKDYPRTPALFMKPASTNLVFKVSQTNDPDFGCETTDKAPGVLATGKWHMIALAVKESAIELYVDGVKKCEKKNSEGGTLTPVPNSQLYISNPWLPPARGQVKSMNYYPGVAFNAEEIGAQMGLEREEAKEL